jgi:arginase family enzyme
MRRGSTRRHSQPLPPELQKTTLDRALASDTAVGLEIAIYNPNLDPDGCAGLQLTQLLAEVLGTRAPVTARGLHPPWR